MDAGKNHNGVKTEAPGVFLGRVAQAAATAINQYADYHDASCPLKSRRGCLCEAGPSGESQAQEGLRVSRAAMYQIYREIEADYIRTGSWSLPEICERLGLPLATVRREVIQMHREFISAMEALEEHAISRRSANN